MVIYAIEGTPTQMFKCGKVIIYNLEPEHRIKWCRSSTGTQHKCLSAKVQGPTHKCLSANNHHKCSRKGTNP